MVRILYSTESRRGRFDAGVPARKGDQHSIELQTKPLQTVTSSDFPKKDLDQRRMLSLRLALESSFAMCLAQERSWLMLSYRHRRDLTSSNG